MTFSFDNLSRTLESIATEPAPPARIDLVAACTLGDRSRRHRRVAKTIAYSCTLSLASVVAIAVLPGAPGAGQGSVPAMANNSAAAPGAQLLTGFPVTAPANFGWLPADARFLLYKSSGSRLASVEAESQVEGVPNSGRNSISVLLTTYRQAARPIPDNLNSGEQLHYTSAPSVNGHKAYWISFANSAPAEGGKATLVWETSISAWAAVTVAGEENSMILADVEHIARTVNTATTTVAASPTILMGIPASAKLQEADLVVKRSDPAGSFISYSLNYALGAGILDIEAVSPSVQLGNIFPGSDAVACVTKQSLKICAQSYKGALVRLRGGISSLFVDLSIMYASNGSEG